MSFASSLFGGFDKEYEALEIVTKVNLGQGKNQLFCLFSLLRLKFQEATTFAFLFLLAYAILLCLKINEIFVFICITVNFILNFPTLRKDLVITSCSGLKCLACRILKVHNREVERGFLFFSYEDEPSMYSYICYLTNCFRKLLITLFFHFLQT